MSASIDLAVAKVLWVAEDSHSPMGPSSGERWIHCPGSITVYGGIPDPGSDFALEGTACHGLSEACREGKLNPQDLLGWTMRVETKSNPSGFKDYPVTQEMVDAVLEFHDRIAEVEGDELCEERVTYDEFVPRGFGKLDAAKMREAFAAVTDLKYGKGVQVFAKDHTQTKIYALGIYLRYHWLYEFKSFWLQICQPRLDHFDSWEITVPDLLKWADEVLRPAAQRVLDGDKTLKAGDWCMFCRAKLRCETYAKYNLQDVVGEFENLDEAVAKTETLELSNLRDNDHVALMLKAADRVVKFFKAIKLYAMKELQQGNKVGDNKLVAGRVKRIPAVPVPQYIRRLLEAGLPEDQAYKMEPITVPQAEKVLGKAAFAPASEATARKPAKDAGPLASLVTRLPGKPTIAPGSDPRPALAQCDPSDFEEEEDYID